MAISRFDGCRSVTTCPSMTMSPEDGGNRPAIAFRSVDLPQPDGPTSTRKPPFSSSISMPLRISTLPIFLRMFLIWRKLIEIYPLTAPAIRPRTK
ncbi:hypothetical protein D3C71_1174900 [compost metagenome]